MVLLLEREGRYTSCVSAGHPESSIAHRLNTAAHMFVGELLHDRIIGALELCCRRGEMLLIQNKRVN